MATAGEVDVSELRMPELVPVIWEYLRAERAAYVREAARYVGEHFGVEWQRVLAKVSGVLKHLAERGRLGVRELEPTPHDAEVLKYDDYKIYYFPHTPQDEVEAKYQLVRFVCDLGWSVARAFEELAYEAAAAEFGVARVRRSPFTSPLPDLQIGDVPDFVELTLRHLNPLDFKYVETHLRRLPRVSYSVVHGLSQHVLFVAQAVSRAPAPAPDGVPVAAALNRWVEFRDAASGRRIYYKIVQLFPERSGELPLFGEFVRYREQFEKVMRPVFEVGEGELLRRLRSALR
ncbi:MAG: hypothetical protein ACXQT6_04430, partial [Candidatus Methanospirareceae archaeon]